MDLRESKSCAGGVSWGGGIPVSQQGEAAGLTSQSDSDFTWGGGLNTGKMVATCWLLGSKTPHWENADCPPTATHLSLQHPYVSGVPQVTVPLLDPKVSAWEQVNLCIGHLRWRLGFPKAFHLTWMTEIPLFFTARCCGVPLPSTSTTGWGAWCGAGVPHSSGGNLHGQDIPPDSQPPLGSFWPIWRLCPSY